MSELTRLLDELPVHDHGPAFWADLDAALAETFSSTSEQPTPTLLRHNGELPSPMSDAEIVEVDSRLARRRVAAAVLAAAAVVVILVFGIARLSEDSGPPPFHTDITVPTTTLDDETVVHGENPTLEWSTETSAGVPDAGVIAGTAHGRFYALVFGAAAGNGVISSEDGITWAPVEPSPVSDEIFADWSLGATDPSGYLPAAFEIADDRVAYAELTTAEVSPPRLRLWQTIDSDTWEFHEIGALPPSDVRDHIAVAPDRGFLSSPPVSVAVSPRETLVSLNLNYEVDWWQFDPGAFDPQGLRPLGQLRPEPTTAGITMVEPFPLDASLDTAPPPRIIPWDEMAPEAQATFDWISTNPSGQQLLAVSTTGTSRLPAPPLEATWRVRWNGEEFEAWTSLPDLAGLGFDVDSLTNSITYSQDGRVWSEPIELPPEVVVVGSIGGNLLATADIDRIVVSRDKGLTFAPIDVDESLFEDPDRRWSWSIENSSYGGDLLETDNGVRILNGVATAMVTRGDITDFWVIRSADGIAWTTSFVDRGGDLPLDGEPGSLNGPRAAAVGDDGRMIVFLRDEVAVGAPTTEENEDP